MIGHGHGHGPGKQHGMTHVVIIDNYDSFTYNLAQAFQTLHARVTVVRNDAIDVRGLERLRPDRLVISAGPGGPAGTGVSRLALRHCRRRLPVLGVCLGHQVIAESLGAVVGPAAVPVHGKRSTVYHDGTGIFAALPNPLVVGRYHSLAIQGRLPAGLRQTAWSERGHVMAIAIPGEATWGVQFHPESFMTPDGIELLGAFQRGVLCPIEER